MEIWDGYFIDGTFANKDLVRGRKIPKGLYHLVAEILVRHTDGDYLLMKRDPSKPSHGGRYEATAGGCAVKGENKWQCAKRELFEETGISSDNFEEIGSSVSENGISYFFLCITDCDKESIKLQKGETIGYKWVSETEFIEFINSDEAISSQRDDYLVYLKNMGYLK